jgi:hypothetical protein
VELLVEFLLELLVELLELPFVKDNRYKIV